MNPTTEVIVCTYNGTAFVIEQLQSILRQTRRVDKISIYDDKSSDGTVHRIKEFISKLPLNEQTRLKVRINDSNHGYARNFTNGIASATEDIIFLCDQDDIWESEKVAILLALFGEQGPAMVFSDGSLIDHAGHKLGQRTVLQSYGLSKKQILAFRENATEFLVKRNYINGAAVAIKRHAAQSALPLPCDMPHDYWLAIWCSIHGGIVATTQMLYRYRQHSNNVIGIGGSNPLYTWMGIWRHPNAPRERELRILTAITARVTSVSGPKQAEAFERKLAWLSSVVTTEKTALSRIGAVLKSAINGNYRRYSNEYSFLRDVISFIK
jgi:glycosyltransferase involved in cell wall biosynthesis